MTVRHIDLHDPKREEVGKRALVARMTLEAARRVMSGVGFRQVRFDQWQNPATEILVETGYTYGEARLVVHHPLAAGPVDFRMVGGEANADLYAQFKKLIGAPKHA